MASVKAVTPFGTRFPGLKHDQVGASILHRHGTLARNAENDVITGTTGDDIVVERSTLQSPDFAVTGRVMFVFDQPFFETGAVWFDDASVLEVQQVLQAEDAMWDGPTYYEGTSGGATVQASSISKILSTTGSNGACRRALKVPRPSRSVTPWATPLVPLNSKSTVW